MFWLFVPLGYLLGSLSAAIITCRLMGLPDPRSDGSGNPGATNVLRLGGKKAAAATLLGDLLKGLIPVAAAQAVGAPELAVAATALAAFLGHLYPIFFRFQGGKGVATAFGAIIALMPLLAGAVLATWLLVAAISRLSSLAALLAAVLAPIYSWLLGATPGTTALLSVLALLLVWRHRSNIRNIAAGTESRIGRKHRD
ncbi:MAG: glycerol-3-phosphate 1-O-acyltransferase PlsY [Pseudomonadota bacterium]